MPSADRRPLLQIGPTTWVSIADVDAVRWNDEERCPDVMLVSGQVFQAVFFTILGRGDTPESRTMALMRLIRKARKRSSDLAEAKILLTIRETEVLDHLSRGESISEIAKILYVSESTVKEHNRGLYRKLGVHNRAGMIMAAIHLGLLDPDPSAEHVGEKPPDSQQ